MEESIPTRYWCHMCSQMVNPIFDVEIKCPFCRSGFVEEIGNGISSDNNELESDFGSERALSLWAPILLGMMGNSRGRRRMRHLEFDEDEEENENDDGEGHGHRVTTEATELDRELDSIIRRRRSSATILQLLQGIRAGMATESENYEGDRNRERERERERERVILINPFNQTIVVQGGHTVDQNPMGSLGDYFVGPGLDLLLQYLAENDPNRYGTPPAQREAVDALPTVRVEDSLQCSVCLDDFEVNAEAKEMPCKHKFHTGCIMPWLELHSSCPVCRHQLPADESKRDMDGGSGSGSAARFMGDLNVNGGGSGDIEAGVDGRNASGRRFPFPWPFNGLFSSQGGGGGGGGGGNSWENAAGASTSDSQRDESSI
ncbi:E3 ubiquitin-protein ligase SIRP1-like [Momordica charantia]|uniref:RING-type E3 ubiquitin transferase n=1 Tax=Momordica charantia TaxID=3673 RepID=A0A6J1DLY0_MOMCH|nr:E3 ubiquitin-protein ligase SIRP1-like [Momordica charantia]